MEFRRVLFRSRELQSKIPAEPGDALLRGANIAIPGGDIQPGPLTTTLGGVDPRWVGKGRTVYNNKGKPVKQYEPFFSSTHLYEPEPEMTDTGVTPILFYDPMDRVVATVHPNHTYEKVVFDPWRQETWDVNDTVTQVDPKADGDVGEFFALLPTTDYLPTWHEQRRNGQKGADEKSAADKAAAHAGTPTVAHFDVLGRPMMTVADNGVDANGVPQKYATRVNVDIEGNQREVIDAKNRVVMRYDHDMLGNRIAQSSMEAGQRWMLNDATGKPILSWDSRDHTFRTVYDELRRPSHSFVAGADTGNTALETCFEIVLYGESPGTGLSPTQVLQANLRGRTYKHFDTAGIATTTSYDFKGNSLGSTRQLAQDYKAPPDWLKNPALETEIFASSTKYDALNRPIQVVPPHSDRAGTKFNVMQLGFNEANLLERMDVWMGLAAGPSSLLVPATANLHAVTNIDYNAKGQRTRIDYGNGASTEHSYDEQTFRLVHLKTTTSSMVNPGLLGRLLGRAGAQPTSVFQDLFYTFDPAGNTTHIRDDAQQTLYFKNQVVLPACDYVYDPIYRLTQATGREHIGQLAQPQTDWDDKFRTNLVHPGDGSAMRNYTDQYFYDALGNFERLVHQATSGNWTRTYAYNESSMLEGAKKSNRLSNTTVGPSTDVYVHDAHGNMISMPHLTLMQWDFKDQLCATSKQSAASPETTYYLYDAGGQRVRKVTERQNGTRKEERVYLGGFEVFRSYVASGATIGLERETLHVIDDKQRVALVETRTTGNDGSPTQLIRYQFGNHLGSASLELEDKGAVISYEEYFPYGSTSYQAVDQSIKAAAKRYRYTGKERDEENGFGYHRARYYAPWLGRWISCDPGGLVDGPNLYGYVRNRPIVLGDHNGMDSDPRSFKERAIRLDLSQDPSSGAVSFHLSIDLQNPKTGDLYSYTSSGDIAGLRSIHNDLLGNSGFAEALTPQEREGLFSSLENFAQSVGPVPAGEQGVTAAIGEKQDGKIQSTLGKVGDVSRGIDRGLQQRYQLEPHRGATVTGIRDTQAGKVRGTPPRPVGSPVIRVDEPHGSTKYPHINIETLNPDPHIPISPGALRAADRLARGLEGVGKVAKPLAIATDAVRLGVAIYEDGGIGRNTGRTAASVAGGWGGAFAGAWVGAEAGAALGGLLGSVVPVLGTAAGAAIGGLLGGLIGGIIGGIVGSSAGEYGADAVLE